MSSVIIILILFFGALSCGLWYIPQIIKTESSALEKLIWVALFFAAILFIFGLKWHSSAYYESIVLSIDPCYTPISYDHAFSLSVVHVFSIASLFLLYAKEFKLPPLIIAICIAGITIGVFVNCVFLYQISEHDTPKINSSQTEDTSPFVFLGPYPILLNLASVLLMAKMVKRKAAINAEMEYKNRFLNCLNKALLKSGNWPFLSIALSIPVFILILLVLILFGQDADSMARVFTDTATWKLSQKMHPPVVLPQSGHYLCTVAARGNPKIVRPIRLGKRNHGIIIVNRQLQIANAFEQAIQDISPTMHRFIRSNYDRYGLNLSKQIDAEWSSNLVYIAMKPLEWTFLIVLYAYYRHPEAEIARQYTA